jgi:hypothetical protein
VTKSLKSWDSVSPIIYLVESSADGKVYYGVLNNPSLFAGKVNVEYQVEPQA